MQSISNTYVTHLILYLRCKFHGSIPNDCQDIANLLLGYFNLGHPVYCVGWGVKLYSLTQLNNIQNAQTDAQTHRLTNSQKA